MLRFLFYCCRRCVLSLGHILWEWNFGHHPRPFPESHSIYHYFPFCAALLHACIQFLFCALILPQPIPLRRRRNTEGGDAIHLVSFNQNQDDDLDDDDYAPSAKRNALQWNGCSSSVFSCNVALVPVLRHPFTPHNLWVWLRGLDSSFWHFQFGGIKEEDAFILTGPSILSLSCSIS